MKFNIKFYQFSPKSIPFVFDEKPITAPVKSKDGIFNKILGLTSSQQRFWSDPRFPFKGPKTIENDISSI